MHSSRLLLVLAAGLAGFPAAGLAQSAPSPQKHPWVEPLVLPGTPLEDRLRIGQLLDSANSTAGLLLRSPSSTMSRLEREAPPPRLTVVSPYITTVYNSGLPQSGNDGALWAGRGFNIRAIAGMRIAVGPLRLIAAPELVRAANRGYEASDRNPRPGPPLSEWANRWHAGPESIDMPFRFGDGEFRRLDLGQSSFTLRASGAELGVATENEWWGPGVRNALILSNNAPGFPHAFARTAAPLATRLGTFEARWLVGGLTESPFFDSDPDNDLRSISLLGVTWRPRWERGLTLGFARAVFAPASDWGDVARSFPQVFANVPPPDAPEPGQRDQLFSLFFRWVFPDDGFEAYAEWARAEQPVSLRDFLLAPNHSQAYTLGFQWIGNAANPWRSWTRGRVRARGEVSYLERSTTYRYRPIGTWYTSRRVPQGYSNRGQTLGAATGPGGSSQYLSIDYLADAWQVGVFAERIRYFEDFHATDPGGSDFCNHDVSVLPGASMSMRTRLGTFDVSYSTGWRHSVYFLARASSYACPFIKSFDVRANSLALTFTALSRW